MYLFQKGVLDSRDMSSGVATEDDIRKRLNLWKGGKYKELWRQFLDRDKSTPFHRSHRKQQRKAEGAKQPRKAAIDRAIELVRENQASLAVRTLQSHGTAPLTIPITSRSWKAYTPHAITQRTS